MSEERPQFPDYGDNGDTAGVRRARRSFRLVVVSVVGITGILWCSERLLRHDAAERAYISALTAEDATAVVLLQEAVRADRRWRDQPTPKYIQALAIASAPDVSRKYFDEAISLDPTNEMFRIRYGMTLLEYGRPGEAVQQFANASTETGKNVLPVYLEAAAIAKAGEGSHQALIEALVRVAAANTREATLSFPRPMWSVEYPRDRAAYAEMSRALIVDICAELEGFADEVLADIQRQIGNQQLQRARTWLTELMQLGQRLVTHSEPVGTIQCETGLRIQQKVLETATSSSASVRLFSDEQAIEMKLRIEQALEGLQKYELGRQARIEDQMRKAWITLQMAIVGLVAMVLVHVTGLTLYRVLGFKKSRWTVPHSRIGKTILATGSTALLLMLIVATIIQRSETVPIDAMIVISVSWYTIVGGLILFGLLYPAVSLKNVESVSRKSSRLEDMELTRRLARQTYRRAYASLSVRYYGILSGITACVVCVWILGFRVVTALFPWQFELLASGFLETEREVVKQVLKFLA